VAAAHSWSERTPIEPARCAWIPCTAAASPCTVVIEGTPGQLKASVGEGALHVRLLDPEQREDALRVLGSDAHEEPDPASLTLPVADADQASRAIADLTQADIGLASFALAQPSLDEVFLALTGHTAEEPDDED